ncbi:SusE domain-containing protein [Saccharicrinis aurantiacus]|uniref:SusE domain-containing protein n=1 Tax=Saccharicrinis aurantiacus TaxID=1849719 RepID=UPI002491C860|nr:SusE domain-containing protein [Saccharicrinis aurantiacus]
MKKLNYIYILFFTLAFLSSCAKVTEKPMLGEGTAPVLASPDGSLNYVLTEENAASPFETFIYSAVVFDQPIVSQYTIEVANVEDTNFEAKVDMQESTSQLYQSITNASFNLLLGASGLDKTPEEPTSVNVRVRASNANDSVQTFYSNVITLNVTPYDAVIPPIYVVGDATSAGWTPSDALPLVSISADEYQGTVELTAAPNSFRFLGQNTDWGPEQWFYGDLDLVESVPANLVGPAPANEYGEINFEASEAGTYEILFNKANNSVKFTKQ